MMVISGGHTSYTWNTVQVSYSKTWLTLWSRAHNPSLGHTLWRKSSTDKKLSHGIKGTFLVNLTICMMPFKNVNIRSKLFRRWIQNSLCPVADAQFRCRFNKRTKKWISLAEEKCLSLPDRQVVQNFRVVSENQWKNQYFWNTFQ